MKSTHDFPSLPGARDSWTLTEHDTRVHLFGGEPCANNVESPYNPQIGLADPPKRSELRSTATLRPRALGTQIPLAGLQRPAFDFLMKNHGGRSARTVGLIARISGPLDTTILQTSLDKVVARHESLRTRLVAANGVPQQIVDNDFRCQLGLVALSEVPLDDEDYEAMRFAEAFVQDPVDISLGPLFGAKLLKIRGGAHALILALDHLVSDSESIRILHRELWTAYFQLVRGLDISLPELSVQFADYAVWRKQLYGDWLETHAKYWEARLADAPHVRILADDGLVEAETPIGKVREFQFGPMLSLGLHELAKREQVMLSILVLTIYVAAMSRWCKRSDLLLALVSNGRDYPELVNMIGFLATYIYLRIERADGDNYADLIRIVHQEYLSALEHQDTYGALSIVPECHSSTDLLFNWVPGDIEEFDEDRESRNNMVRVQAKDIILPKLEKLLCSFFETSAKDIVCRVYYRTDFFSEDTVDQFCANLRTCAERLNASRRPTPSIHGSRTPSTCTQSACVGSQDAQRTQHVGHADAVVSNVDRTEMDVYPPPWTP